jgi:hypothetical protein
VVVEAVEEVRLTLPVVVGVQVVIDHLLQVKLLVAVVQPNLH